MTQNKTKIKVIGIGGSGGNTISRLAKLKIAGIELIAINADLQDLKRCRAHLKIQIGKELTKGLGTGMNPEIGKRAALEQKEEITQALRGADMIFITCGMGGGCGTGATPVVAEISKNLGILTIGVVTKPFSFEGAFRKGVAEKGIKKLNGIVDTLIVIQNDKLLEILPPQTSVVSAFSFCDEILTKAVQAISDLILTPGLINVDFADIKAIMKNAGRAIIGVGRGEGEKRVEKAVWSAIHSPLLDIPYKGAKAILFNVSGGRDISLSDIEEIAKLLTQEVNPEAKIIFGAFQDKTIKKEELRLTVIATGL